jgi:hypothetical protein
MAPVVRLGDLGEGEPNDALTWALFDRPDGGDADEVDAETAPDGGRTQSPPAGAASDTVDDQLEPADLPE